MILNIFNSKVNPVFTSPDEPTIKENKKSFEEIFELPSLVLGTLSSKSQVLGIQRNLFARTGKAVPIFTVGSYFHNLEAKGNGNEVVLRHASTKTPVAAVVRKVKTVGTIARKEITYEVYATRPLYFGQSPANILQYSKRMYAFAKIKQQGQDWSVVLERQSKPSYTIHPDAIKKEGKSVASKSNGEGRSCTLTVDEGEDPCLMICLAAIADQVGKR